MERPKIPIGIREYFKKILNKWSVLLFVSPVFVITAIALVFFTYSTYRDLGNNVASQKHSLSSLAALVIKEKLDKIIAIGEEHVESKDFQKLVEAGKWDEALRLDPHMLERIPYIEKVNIFTTQGVFVSTIPYDAGLMVSYGTNFSSRDYFKAFSKNQEPYVSELIVPVVDIDHTLVLILLPIKTEAGKVVGVLVLSTGTNVIMSWLKDVDLGAGEEVYVVDVKGRLVSHPTLLKKRELVDFSSLSPVQKVLNGESGVEIGYNSVEKKEQISAYSPVPGYEWGVVAAQSTSSAFAERNNAVTLITVIGSAILAMMGSSVYILLRDRSLFKSQRDREEILLNSIGDSVIAIDRNWNITLWNKGAERFTGWLSKEVLNKPILKFIKLLKETDRNDYVQFIESVMVTGSLDNIDYPMIMVGRDGKEMVVSVSVSPIKTSDGVIDGVVIVVRDLQKAREASMLRSDFAYASHQLRTPVTEALWLIESVLEESDSKKIKQNAKMAHESLQSVQKMSDELVTVSEIDQGEVYLDNGKFKLINLFDEVIDEVGKKAEGYGIKLRVPAVDPSLDITSSQKLLIRILSELVDNAITYSHKGDEIVLGVKIDKKNIIFEVKDSGIGIDIEHQPLVFTKFFRGSNFSASEIAGAGLGLYIARGYTKILGGTIWFKSEKKGPNKGTAFYVSVPVLEPETKS